MGFMDSVFSIGKACIDAAKDDYSSKKSYYGNMSEEKITSRLSKTSNPMDRIAMGAALKERGYSRDEIKNIVDSSNKERW